MFGEDSCCCAGETVDWANAMPFGMQTVIKITEYIIVVIFIGNKQTYLSNVVKWNLRRRFRRAGFIR
jgi:hypothetical protein